MAVMNLIGLGVLLYPIIFLDKNRFSGQGTALLLIAANILFAVVFATWDWRNNRLAAFASFSTSVFGFLGTSYILAGENPLLLTVLGIVTFYSVATGLLLASPVILIVRRIRIGMPKPQDKG